MQDLANLEPVFSYHTVFISDLHLSSNKTATPYLYEFLTHLDYEVLEELYLVGDIIGGWERSNARQEALPEGERRILDVLNYAAAQNVKVHYMPGNHDEKLRPWVSTLQNRRHFDTFHENINFEQEAIWNSGGDNPKRLKVLHGDQHDPQLFVKWWFRPIATAVSEAYDLLVNLNYNVSRYLYQKYGRHFNAAGKLKTWFKGTIDYIFSHDKVLQGLEKDKLDGMIMGHTHTACFKVLKNNEKQDTYLINDGDWVEDCTAAVVERRGDLPVVIDYREERERRGFGDLPEDDDPHPSHFAAYRRVTDRQVRLIHRLWPARTRQKHINNLIHAEAKYVQHSRERGSLDRLIENFSATRIFNQTARAELQSILNGTKRESYKEIKKDLTDLFARHAEDTAPISGESDYLYLRTVLRQMAVRSERKIRKHSLSMSKAADRLDLHSAARGLHSFKPRNFPQEQDNHEKPESP